MPTSKSITVLGIMSGSSLDGLDMALCRFLFAAGKWKYEILRCMTLPYDKYWKGRLRNARSLSGMELSLLDVEFGQYIGTMSKQFIAESGIAVDLVASHGHTIFHQPEKKITLQVGNGTEIAVITGIPTVSDFRKKDVALGGQGAPLVPAGDKMLFDGYDSCLNLGGFANVSFEENGKRRAYDICPVNTVLNGLAAIMGMDYDHDGNLGRKGTVDPDLFEALNALDYYRMDPPKSLGNEWLDSIFRPHLEYFIIKDKASTFRTVYEHIALQIGNALPGGTVVLVTGGGVYNNFLTERIRDHTTANLKIPDNKLIQYKEALIFGLLGVLRWQGKINCFASVTGATKDSCTGTVYL